MGDDALYNSLKTFTELLEKHYGKETILLIDEYDVPLAKANEYGYYDDMVRLIRGMFHFALKTNSSLYFAVMTGCLRECRPARSASEWAARSAAEFGEGALPAAKESVFTGLNNPKILSLTSVRFDEYFGFSDREVREMLRYYGLEDKYDTVKDWYDGYRFGNVDVYCPWDVINYCYELLWDPSARPKNYWSNTSGNDTIRHFIEQLDNGLTKSELEALTAGETVTKEIHEELTYSELYESMDNLWSVLFMTGYLTCRSITEDGRYVLSIPNREIRNIFERQIMAMFKNNVRKDAATLNEFCNALKTGDAAKTEQLFTAYLGKTISKRDTFVRKEKKENFYQGILLGILGLKGGWSVKSNEESGEGYSDILIRVENEGIGIAIEVKYAENAGFDAACQEGLDQIERMNYAQELYDDDYRIVYKYAIACFKKRCRVMCEKETCDEEQKEKQP